MVTINAHFDGQSIVPDEPVSPPLRSGDRLRIQIEPLQSSLPAPNGSGNFQPLNIHIDSKLSQAIALEDEFNIENS